MKRKSWILSGGAVLAVYLFTVGFGAAPAKKTRTIKMGGPKSQVEGLKIIFAGNAKHPAWIETEGMRMTGNSMTVFLQGNDKGAQSGDLNFDRVEAKGNVTLRADQPNATGNAPRKIQATCTNATITQKEEQVTTLDGARTVRQKVVLRDNVNVTTESAPGSGVKGLTMEGNQVTIATKADGEMLVLAEDGVKVEAIFEE